MHNFRELKVWKSARIMVKNTYLTTLKFPVNEKYGLTSQVRRASVSIASNIAEGCGRGTDKDFARFLNMSLGSAYELETQFILAYDLELIEKMALNKLVIDIQEIQKMLYGLIKSLK